MTYNKLWYAALAFVTLVLFSVAVGAMIFMIMFYTHAEACYLNKIFLGVNSALCVIVSLLAISPCIQTCESARRLPFVSLTTQSAVQPATRYLRHAADQLEVQASVLERRASQTPQLLPFTTIMPCGVSHFNAQADGYT